MTSPVTDHLLMKLAELHADTLKAANELATDPNTADQNPFETFRRQLASMAIEHLPAMLAEIKAFRAEAKWTPMEEGHPKEDGNFLVTVVHRATFEVKVVDVSGRNSELFKRWIWTCPQDWRVTHWRPLPKAAVPVLKTERAFFGIFSSLINQFVGVCDTFAHDQHAREGNVMIVIPENVFKAYGDNPSVVEPYRPEQHPPSTP